MDKKTRKSRYVFIMNLVKLLIKPITRLKKLLRTTTMRQLKIAVGILAISSCIITLVLYCRHRSSFNRQHNIPYKPIEYETTEIVTDKPMKHMPLNEVFKDFTNNNDKDYIMSEMDDFKPAKMIDTVGCQIPVAMIDYARNIKNNTNKKKASCGRRAVFLAKVDHDTVQVLIKTSIMRKYLRKSSLFECCYSFLMKATQVSNEPKKNTYTPCKKMEDKSTISLKSDFIVVKCSEINRRNISHTIYEDIYAFSKKLNVSMARKHDCNIKYNVLMIGMDSMSLPRTVQTMPKTTEFFQSNYWLSYRGYHKVEDNTLPNFMAVLTGKNITTIAQECSGKMDSCAKLMIWNTFKENGYVTAYGEDYLQIPDTFNDNYAFAEPPTDHYMRPLFLRGETEHGNKTLVCAGKVPSGQQLLDFAFDFADTYKKDSFFGLFRMNSFSHNINSRPQDADKLIENFLNRLTYTGALANTFIIFFSDHGLRFGKLRTKMEAYYDDRLPMMFIWPPTIFKGLNPSMYMSLAINQHSLITPYDLYNTLVDIKRLSICSKARGVASEGCPKCQSMFETVDDRRTCQDLAIHENWCSCHKLYPLPVQDTEGKKSVDVAVHHIKTMIQSINTRKCWACMNLSLSKTIRIHFYYDRVKKTKLYYVVAFTMMPGNVSYEVTLLRKTNTSNTTVIGPVSVLSPYRGLGRCAHNNSDRLFCICQEIKNC